MHETGELGRPSHASVERQRLASAIGYAQGYLQAVQAIDARQIKLLDLHDKLVTVYESGFSFVRNMRNWLNFPGVEISDDEAREFVVGLREIWGALMEVISGREYLINGRDTAFWPEELLDQLEELADDISDIEETLALSLSPEVRAAVAEAVVHARSCSGDHD